MHAKTTRSDKEVEEVIRENHINRIAESILPSIVANPDLTRKLDYVESAALAYSYAQSFVFAHDERKKKYVK